MFRNRSLLEDFFVQHFSLVYLGLFGNFLRLILVHFLVYLLPFCILLFIYHLDFLDSLYIILRVSIFMLYRRIIIRLILLLTNSCCVIGSVLYIIYGHRKFIYQSRIIGCLQTRILISNSNLISKCVNVFVGNGLFLFVDYYLLHMCFGWVVVVRINVFLLCLLPLH